MSLCFAVDDVYVNDDYRNKSQRFVTSAVLMVCEETQSNSEWRLSAMCL